jgi:hypothetical protein
LIMTGPSERLSQEGVEMKDEGQGRPGSGITRRVFINRGFQTAGGVVFLTRARGLSAKAEPAFQGTFTRMARMVFDPERDRRWVSYLKIDLDVNDIDTQWGPTRVTHARDAVMVKFKAKDRYTEPVDVSGGTPDAKLDPRIDARGGRACVTWCACHPETKQWRVFATCSNDGKSWTGPTVIAGGDTPALHPSVALDPETGRAWIAYEDWSDGSIRLAGFDGISSTQPVKVSEGGRNLRPRVIKTSSKGKHSGAIAVAWDSYRNRQYDIYLRLLYPGGSLGPELRATRCPRWDSYVDLIEDLDSNLWITWIRASTETGNMSAMRNVHVKFFDGREWHYPSVPEHKYSPAELTRAWTTMGIEPPGDKERQSIRNQGMDEDRDGRITWFTANWFPKLAIDNRNRVYVFYREGDILVPPLYAHLKYRVYEGDRWAKPQRIKLGRGPNLLRMLRDFSVAITRDGHIEGVWDEAYMNLGREVLKIQDIERKMISDAHGPRFKVHGDSYEETMHPGWPEQKTLHPTRKMELNGKSLVLLFGDTHNHSSVSIGVDPPDYHYHFARDYAKLDFFALPENDYLFCGVPGIEAYISFLPKVFSSDEFICFQAHEFVSSAMGHRVMVFEGNDKDIFPLGVFNSQRGIQKNTTGYLYNFLHKFDEGPGSRVMVSAHNMVNLGNDFKEYDHSLEPLYDVGSIHMAAEKTFEEYKREGKNRKLTRILEKLLKLSRISAGKGGCKPENKWYFSWRQCLAAGLTLGAYGSSDNHCVNGIGWVFAGVWASEKSKKDIFDALFAKTTFAVDNQLRLADIFNTDPGSGLRNMNRPALRMDIRFWLNHHFMGSKCRINGPPTARVSVFTPDAGNPVREIVFVRDGKEVHVEKGFKGQEPEATWQDNNWTQGRHYYYARVELEGGSTGYSSPVFVNY